MRSAAAKRPEPPSSTTTRSLPGPGQPQPCGRSFKQQSNQHLAALLAKQHYQQGRCIKMRTTHPSRASWDQGASTMDQLWLFERSCGESEGAILG